MMKHEHYEKQTPGIERLRLRAKKRRQYASLHKQLEAPPTPTSISQIKTQLDVLSKELEQLNKDILKNREENKRKKAMFQAEAAWKRGDHLELGESGA